MLVCIELRAEVEKLKQLNSAASVGDTDVISQTQREVAWLRQQLMMREAEMDKMKRSADMFTVIVIVAAANGYKLQVTAMLDELEYSARKIRD